MVEKRFNYRHLMYAIFDFVATFGIVYLSFLTFLFRSNDLTNTQIWGMLFFCLGSSIVTVTVFFFMKIYKIVTIYFSFFDAMKVGIVTACIQIVGLIVLLVFPSEYLLRPSIAAWALASLSLVSSLVGIRILVRWGNAMFHFKRGEKRVRSIVVGAGALGKIALEDSKNSSVNHHKVVLFIDDDPGKIGGVISNIPIRGPIKNIATFIDKYDIEEVIIAINNYPREKLDELLAILRELDVRINRMPTIGGMIGPNDVKMTRIDIDGLLDRETIKLDNEPVKDMLNNETVLITGAGGSIGSELCRQVLECKPKNMILFDIYENSTYEIQQELSWRINKENIPTKLIVLIGSTYDLKRIEGVFEKYHPNYVYHAAAYKHVPLMENSPMEAIRTNILGTYNVALCADKYKVKKMLLVSTDKAVRPTNTMGATKRFAELIIQYFASKSSSTTYCAVRFGNVLGSNGSVVPLFEKQIKNGGPITVTDKDIIRYFMTIPEAVSLILHCSMLANSGELFILDMGTPVPIVSLAEHMIRQAGYIPYKDIDIVYTGLRPGEKLYEETLVDLNKQERTSNGRIFIEKQNKMIDVPKEIKHVSTVFDLSNNNEIKTLLASIIPSYTPDLDHE